jgi:hypothetical protein
MRKLLTAAIALISALAFLVVASPSASAFGSEVLGCHFDSDAWSAGPCYIDGPQSTLTYLHFEPHNTSGSYLHSWSLINQNGAAVTQSCDSTISSVPCIYSGCTTSTPLACVVANRIGANDHSITATLYLAQAGQAENVTAKAYIDGVGHCPTSC